MQATASTLLVSHRRGATVIFVREKPGAASLVGLAAAVAGLLIGRTAVGAAGRSAANPEQAARRRYGVVLAVMVLGAALLLIDAIDTPRHRYLNLAVVVIMVAGVAFDWVRTRRRTRSESPQQTEDE
jgi:F0F1-type ATP synthase membrane subunit c/vacuolar-type H+-ATPase subunit K